MGIFEHFANEFPLVSDECRRWTKEGPFLLDLARSSGGGRILDLACGNGFHARHLAGEGFDVTGVELSASAIRMGKSLPDGDRVRWIVGDITKQIPGSFDLVLLVGNTLSLFQHESEVRKILSSVSGILASASHSRRGSGTSHHPADQVRSRIRHGTEDISSGDLGGEFSGQYYPRRLAPEAGGGPRLIETALFVVHVIDFSYLRKHPVRIKREGIVDGRRVIFEKRIEPGPHGAVIRITVMANDEMRPDTRTEQLFEHGVPRLTELASESGLKLCGEAGGLSGVPRKPGETKDVVIVFELEIP